MTLLKLAARICNQFDASNSEKLRVVQKVKDNQVRDVVTELDMRLHQISEQFVSEYLKDGKLLSEEGKRALTTASALLDSEWLIVDPLDGSNNFSVGLPNYGFMAAQLKKGKIIGAVTVLPEFRQYIVFENEKILFAQQQLTNEDYVNGTIYYAYPPQQDKKARDTRIALQELIDHQSAGMYRYGSACVGLYQLLCGRHKAFIGHGIRIWDAIAYLPILSLHNIKVNYCIKGLNISLIASRQKEFVNAAAELMFRNEGLKLQNFVPNEEVRIEEL
jgi:myo-inositol-1(or 4)-monophosphatase